MGDGRARESERAATRAHDEAETAEGNHESIHLCSVAACERRPALPPKCLERACPLLSSMSASATHQELFGRDDRCNRYELPIDLQQRRFDGQLTRQLANQDFTKIGLDRLTHPQTNEWILECANHVDHNRPVADQLIQRGKG